MVPLQPLLNVLLACTVLTRASAAGNDPLAIQLPTGIFRGFSPSGSHVDQWLGIAFAEPPVGPLRFKAPVPIKGEPGGIKDATQFGNACPQAEDDGSGAPISEDCLYLNVNHLVSLRSLYELNLLFSMKGVSS
jgi:hypothetical protein